MAFNTKWDINKYRAEYESDEHWSLKAKFINAHKSRFPEEELICLAQVFFNVEFMGCRYPAETMTLIAELSKDVAHEFRESRKNRLKRTFVTASDAIEAKYKSTKETSKEEAVPTFTRQQRIEFAKAKCAAAASTSSAVGRKRKHGEELCIEMPKRPKIPPNGDPIRKFYNQHPDVVLFQGNEDEPAVNILRASMDKNKITTKYETPEHGQTWMLLNGTRMLYGASKVEASAKLLKELQKYYYTIKRKTKFLSRTKTIEKDDQRLSNTPVVPKEHAKIDSNNLGFKLLQSLGWSGGGLGSANKGIEEPIQADIKVGRSGLGNTPNGKLDRRVVKNLLTEYRMTNDLCDLVFSTEFTKEERAVIHSIAQECHLKSSSFGKLEDRQIVISKHSTIQELFVLLQNNTDPLHNEKYEIIPPTELSL